MRLLRPTGVALGLFAVLASCAPDRQLAVNSPTFTRLGDRAAVMAPVRISEFHYDNPGTDIDEKIEISGPAGTSLNGWQLVLFNGSSTVRAPYNTTSLTGLTIPGTCGDRGVIVVSYGTNGIQNGSSSATGIDPDGIALVDATGSVVEFLSYEGSFTAASGPAAGMTSTDIGIRELGAAPEAAAPPVWSLSRNGAGVWSGPALNTFGACNDNDGTPPAVVASVTVEPASATIVEGSTRQFTAAAFDAANNPVPGVTFTWSSSVEAVATVNSSGLATGVSSGDTEIRATSPNGKFAVANLHVDEPPPEPPAGPVNIVEIHYDDVGADAGEAIEIEGPAGMNLGGWSIVLYNGNGGAPYGTIDLSGVISNQCSGRGTLQFAAVGLQNGSPDGLALVKPGNIVVEFLSYEGTLTGVGGPANGMISTDIGVSEDGEPEGRSLQKDADGWYGPVTSSFGACNVRPVTPPSFISISGRTSGDPALPVGFQDQLFGTLINGSGNSEPTTITWSSDTPDIATIDQDGVFTALTAGTAILRATADDAGKTTSTISLPTRVAVAGGAQYANHTEFGTPTDANASDDFILSRTEYTSSFNKNRGIPNWVSFNIEATHYGPEDRCDCFTYDPLLPASFTRYTTADYTGAGTFHGYGIDRGHLARSFDRTSGSLDNARSFLFSNIIPQAADNNQGPWANMENAMGDLARFQDKELFVIAGASGSKGTVKDEGKITIPATTWKVVVVMPRDQGLANVDSYDDVEVIAVIMPNDPGIRNVPWETYKTTVDAIEALSGYDLLALLSDQIEIAIESNTKPPVAATNGPYTSSEGSSVSMSGAASGDPDGDALTYSWSFGDGQTGSGVATSHTYAQNGSYSVTLTVTDTRGLFSVTTTTALVSNVAPVIAPFAGATLLPGETYSASGSFTDPGADAWTATVNYGEGATVGLALAGKNFSLSHRYESAGTFTVTVRVTDDVTTSARMQTVTVLTPVQALQPLLATIQENSLRAKLEAAIKSLAKGNTTPAVNQLQAFLHEVDAMVKTGRLDAATADAWRAMIDRVILSATH